MVLSFPYRSNKKIMAICFAVVLGVCVLGQAVKVLASNNDVTFPDENWDVELLKKIEVGPVLLPANFDTGIEAPAANGSVETVAELNSLMFFKKERTPDQLTKIKNEDNADSVLSIFEQEGLFDPHKTPKTKMFFDQTRQDVEYFILRDKKKFSRVRPSMLNSDLELVVQNPPYAAYPSGHAAQSFFVAYTLGHLNPEQAGTYEQLAREIAHRREVAGIHYPSDSEAGFRLAKNVFNGLMQNEKVKALYNQAEKEFVTN